MKLLLKNTQYNYLITVLYLSAVVLISVVVFAIPDFYIKNPLGFYFFSFLVFLIVGMLIKFIPHLTSELKIAVGEIEIKKWGFLASKNFIIKSDELDKIEVSYGIVQKSQLILYFKNNNKLGLDINYINKIEGQLPEIELSQYAPSDPTLKLTLQVAVLLSKDFNVPFETSYLR